MKHINKFDKFIFKNISETVAYHGSPSDFSYFSTNMIGTGEGGSGFGYGFYFSEDIDDAKDYARKLEKERGAGRLFKVKIPDKKTYLNLDEYYEEQSEYVKKCLKSIPVKDLKKIFKYDVDLNKDIKKFNDDVENKEYDFNIHDKEYNDTINEFYKDKIETIHAGSLYILLDEVLDGEYNASKFLYDIGIKGNIHSEFKCLHYIVFNDNDIEILKKTKPRY